MFEPCSLWNAGARRAVSCPYVFIRVLVGILERTSHIHGHALSLARGPLASLCAHVCRTENTALTLFSTLHTYALCFYLPFLLSSLTPPVLTLPAPLADAPSPAPAWLPY